MSQGEFNQNTASNHYVSALYFSTKQQGLDADNILRGAGFDLSVINSEQDRVNTEQLAEYQNIIWQVMGDEAMGHLPFKLPLGSFEMMGHLAVHQPDLRNALIQGTKFYNLVTQYPFVKISHINDNVELCISIPDHEIDYEHLCAELSLLVWHRFSSWLIAETLPLVETHFDYTQPSHVGEYSYLYPSFHRFNSDKLCIVFPAKYLDNPVKQSKTSLKTFLNRCPLEIFRRYTADYSLTYELKYMLEKSLTVGRHSIADLAKNMHISPKTLMRRLNSEGTSFQQVKDVIRRDTAIKLLTSRSLSIQDIAESVGYSDPAVFARAFKNWTNKTPRQYRDKFRENTSKKA